MTAIGAKKIRLHVPVVIELNPARVAGTRAKHGKFRMIGLEAVNVACNICWSAAHSQICVAPRAIRIACGRQANRSAMIGVAGGAVRRKLLRCMMDRAVVAGKALLVGDFFAKKTGLRDMARSALPGEHGM